MAKRKSKKEKTKGNPGLSLLFLITGAAMMVKAVDVATFLKVHPDHVFLASIGLMFYGVFDLLILPLFKKNDNNQ